MEIAEKEKLMEEKRFKDKIARDDEDDITTTGNCKETHNSKNLKSKDGGGETNPNHNKGKSCKGCLYYSSALKSHSRNPLCIGFTRSLPQGQFLLIKLLSLC